MENELVTASIIIPYYNHWELTHQRLAEIYKYAPEWCEVILVDDASTDDDCARGLKWWKENTERHTIRYFRNPENLGFGGTLNNGVRLAKGKYVILLSNDVEVSKDIFSDISLLIGDDNKMLVGGRIIDWPGGWNEFDIDGEHYVVPYAEGWLLACTAEAFKKLGGFDIRYGKFDYEDLDLSTKALQLGYNIVGLNSRSVRHIGGQTISGLNVNRIEKTKKNRDIYIMKWANYIPNILLKLESVTDEQRTGDF